MLALENRVFEIEGQMETKIRCGLYVILDLMDRLPADREENIKRLIHTMDHGFLLILKVDGEVKGCAEVFRMKKMPDYPVFPWPKDDPDGKILYCYSAVTEKDHILKFIQLAKKKFSDCKYIGWHHEKRNHKPYLERI